MGTAYHIEKHKDPFNRWDLIWIVLLTVVFAGIAFYRIGSTQAPQTYWKFDAGDTVSDEVILNFDEEIDISRIHFFIGLESRRTFSFSSYNYDTGEWEVFASKQLMGEAFRWQPLRVGKSIRSLGIVSLNEHAYINEMVILDENGRQVLPVNADEYRELFDEQELFTRYATYYDQTMFDEIFHARTAYEFVNHLPVYETSHPPLGKLLISLGIRLCGMTPFGWRLIPALFGIAAVPLLYLFARSLTGKRRAAVFTTILFDSEFMHVTMSRIATLDIIIAFFVLLMFFFMYIALEKLENGNDRKGYWYLWLCGCATACAVATKWTGVYAAVGIAVCFFVWLIRKYRNVQNIWQDRRRIVRLTCVCICSFLLIPAVVYCLSYIPYTWEEGKDIVTIAIENSIHIFEHHSNDIFDHAYSSPWYEWIWDKRPMVYTLNSLKDGRISIVVSFGNPIIWWGGLLALVHQLYLWLRRRDRTAGYLCISYFAMMVPWIFITRTVFIYQYFIPGIILILMLGNSFTYIGKKEKECMIGFAALAVAVFLLFWPVITGQAVSREYASHLEWLETWDMS